MSQEEKKTQHQTPINALWGFHHSMKLSVIYFYFFLQSNANNISINFLMGNKCED
jgi:hypothetical protein